MQHARACANDSRAPNLFQKSIHSGSSGGQCAANRKRSLNSMTFAPPINGEALRETFRAWNVERDTLDTELNESVAALEAYQLHLDSWQQQLARERDELRDAREQFSRERTAAEKG